MELTASTFKLDITDRAALTREFYELQRIATQPIFYRLTYPRDFSMLPAVRQAILDHLYSE